MKRIVGHYEILEKLGEGGMGIVYKARDVRLDRLVALKMLSGERLDSNQKERLIYEARTASALNHPNIVTIYEVDARDGMQLIAMEYVVGKSLAELIRPGGLPILEVLRYGVQIAEACAKAHAAGIIHRDLKPGNIMVSDDGVVKILDFGLAKRATLPESDASTVFEALLSKPGLILGTVAYMSPEQALGETVDPRSDVFSLGIILYELFSGVRPFLGNTTLATLHRIQIETPHPLKLTRADLPRRVETIVHKALQKDRANRYQTMQALRADLERAAEEGTHGAEPMLPRKYRLPSIVLLLAMVLMLLIVLAASMYFRDGSPEPKSLNPAAQTAAIPPVAGWTRQAQLALERYDKTENIERALQFANKAVEIDHANALGYAIIAEAYYFKNAATPDPQWARLATESSRKSVELNSDLAAAHLARGLALLDTASIDEAGHELMRAGELDPLNADPYIWLGEYNFKKNNLEAAENSYKHAIEVNAGSWNAYNRYGRFLYKNARYDEAIRMWEQSLTLTQDNVTILKNLGAAYHMLDKNDEAAAVFQRALEVEPTAAAYNNLGTARFFQGKYSDAAEAFDKAVQSNGASYMYWGNLGDARRWIPGQEPEAKSAYAHAVSLVQEKLKGAENDPELRSTLAVYLAKSGDRQGALSVLAQLEKLQQRTPGSYFKALVAYEICGDRAKALAALQSAKDKNYSLKEIRDEPELAKLRSDRRYHEIIPD